MHISFWVDDIGNRRGTAQRQVTGLRSYASDKPATKAMDECRTFFHSTKRLSNQMLALYRSVLVFGVWTLNSHGYVHKGLIKRDAASEHGMHTFWRYI